MPDARSDGEQHGGAATRRPFHLALTSVERVRSAFTPHSRQITAPLRASDGEIGLNANKRHEPQSYPWGLPHPAVILAACALPPSFFCLLFSHKYFMARLFSCLRRSSHSRLHSVDADSHPALIPAGAVAASVQPRTPFLKTQLRGRGAGRRKTFIFTNAPDWFLFQRTHKPPSSATLHTKSVCARTFPYHLRTLL